MRPVTARALYHTGRPGRLAKSRQRGLTLIELVVAIAVLAILVTWAIPGFQSLTARNEVAAEVLRLKTALAVARNTAVTRGTAISICASPGPTYDTCAFDDWDHDWVIVEGEVTGSSLAGVTVLRVLEASDKVQVNFNRDDRPVRFSAMGWSQGYNGTFNVCGGHGSSTSIVLNNTGRVRATAAPPSC
ncbi:GspH/FimT family pseudopilin [Halomonas sp. EGI 63088]|uniref:Type II secretion system protein H n=1 Tax=Halomonas flagellata TaxID=2920385 RepID=A0ABS9RXF6_9GAMM|nr:GspH/FimT family pseudopilin [Halomonas flagellata]MCH4564496.1 GspH/FimT family pseudopilin [Halomonas flagellata]